MAAYTLCAKCNNTRSNQYINSFRGFIDQCNENYYPSESGIVLYRHFMIEPLAVIKAVMSMFLCILPPGIFKNQDHYPNKFVIDTQARGLPREIRIFMYYYPSELWRFSSLGITMKMIEGRLLPLAQLGAELSFSPVGFALSLDNDNQPLPAGLEIPHFSNYRSGEFVSMYPRMPILSPESTFPGSFVQGTQGLSFPGRNVLWFNDGYV